MNREQRRKMKGDPKAGLLQSPCSIAEAVQIARGVAEDVVNESQIRMNHVQVAMSLQMEIIKEILISKGLITEEEFKEKYVQRAEEFNAMQMKMQEERHDGFDFANSENPDMKPSVGDIEITKE